MGQTEEWNNPNTSTMNYTRQAEIVARKIERDREGNTRRTGKSDLMRSIFIVVAEGLIQLFLIATFGLPRRIAKKRDANRFGPLRKGYDTYHRGAIKVRPPTIPCRIRRPLTPPPIDKPRCSDLFAEAISGNSPWNRRRNAHRDEIYYQPQSRFFTVLPAEIRMHVYSLVYEECYLHIFSTASKKLTFNLCSPDPLKRDWKCGTMHDAQRLEVGYTDTYYTTPPHSGKGAELKLTSLLKTCRRIYRESVDKLYSEPTFIFTQPWPPLDFYRTILPHRFNAITKIRLHKGYYSSCRPIDSPYYYPSIANSFTDTCEILANMTHLRELIVVLDFCSYTNDQEYLRRPSVFEDLKMIKQPKRFIVYAGHESDGSQDTPYQVSGKSFQRNWG